MSKMEEYFKRFRDNIIGIDQTFESPFGERKIIYADWIASGRLYKPIEDKIINDFGPFVANTHTETNETGELMTRAYHYSHEYIKNHVNAGPNDVIITAGFGMTSVINKLMRILGLKGCGAELKKKSLTEDEHPVVFITHMEHHSNHTGWFETMADVVLLEPDENLLIDLNQLKEQLEKYKNRKFKIGSFTACSNVTGIETPYHEMAKLMHEYQGLAFIDFAASAPYVDINMHPDDPMAKLDAIFFSPHKFLGGPGSSGVLVFDKSIYNSEVPDNPGGGTVDWTNRWGEYKYVDDIESREDGGTPGFLQSIKGALAMELKEQMGVKNIKHKEEELVKYIFNKIRSVPGLHILADNIENRLGIFSFYIDGIHYNLVAKVLNDLYGIQVRSGCACAGTYGHFLLEVSYEKSHEITELINHGDLSKKPGWIRYSVHPTTTIQEVDFFIEALYEISTKITTWKDSYVYSTKTNEFNHKLAIANKKDEQVKKWFTF